MSNNEHCTLNKILTVAYQEFLQNGFQGASLRNIVKQAGVTTGAFYGYFKSKEELFDTLVKEPYDHLLTMYQAILNQFHNLPVEEQRTCMTEYALIEMTHMTDYIYDNFQAFQLILCASEGTSYENLIHVLTQMDCDATHEFSDTMQQTGISMNVVHPQLEHMLTSGMFCAYFEMVIHQIPREQATQYSKQLIQFYEAGWQKILGF